MKTPNSFWLVWYECRPSVVQISICGKYFFAMGQDAAWELSAAEFVEEINVWDKFGFYLTSTGEITKQ